MSRLMCSSLCLCLSPGSSLLLIRLTRTPYTRVGVSIAVRFAVTTESHHRTCVAVRPVARTTTRQLNSCTRTTTDYLRRAAVGIYTVYDIGRKEYI